jgi:hypothetical protein
MFDNATQLWSNLGGTGSHDISSTDVVYVVAKHEHGMTSPEDTLWVGGKFVGSLKYFVESANQWFDVQNSPNTLNDTIVSFLHYQKFTQI